MCLQGPSRCCEGRKPARWGRWPSESSCLPTAAAASQPRPVDALQEHGSRVARSYFSRKVGNAHLPILKRWQKHQMGTNMVCTKPAHLWVHSAPRASFALKMPSLPCSGQLAFKPVYFTFEKIQFFSHSPTPTLSFRIPSCPSWAVVPLHHHTIRVLFLKHSSSCISPPQESCQ